MLSKKMKRVKWSWLWLSDCFEFFVMKIRKTILSSRMKRTVWGVLHGQCVHTHLQIYWVSRLSLTVVKQIFWLNCSAFDSTILTWLTVSPRVSLSFFLVNWVTDSPTDSRLTTWLTGSPNLLTMVLHPTYRFTTWLVGSPNLLISFLHLTQRPTWLNGSPRDSTAFHVTQRLSGWVIGSPALLLSTCLLALPLAPGLPLGPTFLHLVRNHRLSLKYTGSLLDPTA